jgi:hypothetical protein
MIADWVLAELESWRMRLVSITVRDIESCV